MDAESGKSIPYAGAGFKIYDPQGNQVKMTFTYPTPTTIDVFYTDANGSLVTPEKLDYYNLLTRGELTQHLAEVEQRASKMEETILNQMAQKEGVTDFWTLGLQAGGERKYSLPMPEVPE